MDNLLMVQNLTKKYPIKGGFFQRVVNHVHAVTDVTLDLKKGETLGLVGESGCGKSTLGRHIMFLEKPTAGKVIFRNEDLTHLSDSDIRVRRSAFQMIFQDPFSSLNPKMTVQALLAEPIKNFYPKKKKKEIRGHLKRLNGKLIVRWMGLNEEGSKAEQKILYQGTTPIGEVLIGHYKTLEGEDIICEASKFYKSIALEKFTKIGQEGDMWTIRFDNKELPQDMKIHVKYLNP